MKLGGECDFSTSQPLVLTTVSRCQLTSASPAVMLSFRLSTFSLTLIHENILIGYQQKRTLKENDKNPSFLPPPFFLLLFLNFYMPSSFSPFPPPPLPTSAQVLCVRGSPGCVWANQGEADRRETQVLARPYSLYRVMTVQKPLIPPPPPRVICPYSV